MRQLPYPGAPDIQNLVATMRMHGNTNHHQLDLKAICKGRPFTPDELAMEFCRQASVLTACGEFDK